MTDKQIIEHELLYEGLDWSVGVDGMFINPKQIPYTNCLYELALACDSKSKQLKYKEQECEELKKIINEAKNSKLDLKSFLVGEAVQNEYEQQLDQLKAENEELKKDVIEALKLVEITSTHNTFQESRINKLSKTLTEIKEIAESEIDSKEFMAIQCMLNGSVDNKNKVLKQILQKISECEGNDD